MNILLLGASGFVGCYLYDILQAKEYVYRINRTQMDC